VFSDAYQQQQKPYQEQIQLVLTATKLHHMGKNNLHTNLASAFPITQFSRNHKHQQTALLEQILDLS
jgi:hypothetical protein